MSDKTASVADMLARLYAQSFGGKASGRYRVPQKLLREMFGVRRLYADDIERLHRTLFERGYLLIDMDSFYVIMSTNSFVNYRRLSHDAINEVAG